jgi:hypothetical protein
MSRTKAHLKQVESSPMDMENEPQARHITGKQIQPKTPKKIELSSSIL